MSKVFDLLRDVKDSPSQYPLNSAGELPRGRQFPENRTLRGEVLAPFSQPEPMWARSLEVLRQHWPLAAMFAGVVITIVTMVTLLTKPMYEPVAALQIDPPGTETFSLQGGNSDSNSGEYITTQTKKLQSNVLAMQLAQKLRLDHVSEFAGRNAIAVADPTPEQQSLAESAALKTLLMRTSVKRDTSSRIVYVSIGARDPKLASTLTNSLATLFLENEEKARHEAVLRSSQWLGKQLDDIRLRMEESNRTVGEFERRSGIAPLGDSQSSNTFSEQMIELNRQLLQARSDRIQLQSYLSRMGGTGSAMLPQVSANPVVQGLTQRLAETRAELTNALAIYGPNHPNVRRLQNQSDELQSQLDRQKASILGELRNSYQASQVREGMVQGQVKEAEKKVVLVAQYMAIKKEAEANTQLYNSLSAKIREAGIAAESKSNPIWIVDPAPVLDRPTRPHKGTQIGLGVLFALCGGVLLVFVVEGFNTSVRTTADVQRSLGMVPVSVMPVIGKTVATQRLVGSLFPNERRQKPPLFLLDSPRSPEAEALRAFYTSVRLTSSDAPQVLLVTSPDPGEGKTTMTVNLAIALSERGRTCVVDADLRKEGVAPAFGIKAERGLRDVLAKEAVLKESLIQTKVENLSLLPAGKPCDEVARLICSDTMAEVLMALRSEFEYVLVDSPPVLPFADCRALATLVDGVVLVGRSGRTRGEDLVRAMELLQNVHSAPVIQVVLNAVQSTSHDYSSYYYGHTDRKTGRPS
jgi:polysaccharide biosynthesis transport protein